MIAKILDTVILNDLYNVSEIVELAKGKREKVYTWKGAKNKIKRAWRLKRQ